MTLQYFLAQPSDLLTRVQVLAPAEPFQSLRSARKIKFSSLKPEGCVTTLIGHCHHKKFCWFKNCPGNDCCKYVKIIYQLM